MTADQPYTRIGGLEELAAGYQRLLSAAALAGIRIAPTSRIRRYGEQIVTAAAGGKYFPGDLQRAVLEIQQMIAISDTLSPLPEFGAEFAALVGGPGGALLPPSDDRPRDKQFELFVAARLRQRIATVRLAEPDIVVNLGGHDVAFAVKRPHSITAIRDLVRKGAKQIRRWKMPGFIVVDTSSFPVEEGLHLVTIGDTDGALPNVVRTRLCQIVQRAAPMFVPLLQVEPDHSGVQGIVFHLAIALAVGRGAFLRTGEIWAMCPVGPADAATVFGVLELLGGIRTAGDVLRRPWWIEIPSDREPMTLVGV